MIRTNEAEILVYWCVVESRTMPLNHRVLFLKIAALLAAREKHHEWSELTLDSLKVSLEVAGLHDFLKLLQPPAYTDEPDEFTITIAPPPPPSIWHAAWGWAREKLRGHARHAA